MTHDARLTTALAVEIQPQRLELSISATEPTQGELEITNHKNKPVEIRLNAGPYRHFQRGLDIPSAENWLTFEPKSFRLGEGLTGNVQYTITPPINASSDSAGEYLAAILIDEIVEPAPLLHGTASQTHTPTNSQTPSEASGTITIVPRFAMPVYLQIKDKERVAISIQEFSVEDEHSYADPAADIAGISENAALDILRLNITLKNNGTVHVRPYGTFAIIREDGEIVKGGQLGRVFPLLPTAELTFPARTNLPEPGQYRAVVTLEADVAGEQRLPEPLQAETAFEVTELGEVVEKRS